MKQVININFQGRVVPIEQTAYETLKQYISSLNNFFENEDGKEEIVNDIENRIAELFQQKLKDGSSCITDADVEAIKRSIGTPEDFGAEEGTQASSANNTNTNNTFTDSGTTANEPKKLYRNENEKILGGVCSGLAGYFGIDTVVVRLIFVILFFGGFGFSLIAYIVLWAIVPSTASLQIGSPRRRLFRDVDDKYLGGVCSGIAHYFGMKPWIPRLIFLLPVLFFSAKWTFGGWHDINMGLNFTPILIYIIMWLLIPEAKSTSEKLEMKGEKVDLETIKNNWVGEMKNASQRVQQMGSQFAETVSTGARNVTSEAGGAYNRNKNSLGNIISLLVKIVVYFFLGVVFITLLALLFGLAIAAFGLFPLKDFVLTGGQQNLYAWGTLLFFIIVPIVGLITWIVRRITKQRGGSIYMRSTFIMLWILGWVCAIFLLASVGRDFKRQSNMQTETVALSNPGVNKLLVTNRNTNEFTPSTRRFFKLEPYNWVDDDTALVPNVTINIFKALNDSFSVSTVKVANGRTRQFADTAASMIRYNVVQKDSVLLIDKGIAINKTDKFRNQHVIINIFVPVGKQIRIDRNIDNWNVNIDGWEINNHEYSFENENAMQGWRYNVDYIMKNDGLYTLDGTPASKFSGYWDDNNDEEDQDGGNIRIRRNGNSIRIENGGNTENKVGEEALRVLDSMRKEIKDVELNRKDSLQKEKEKIDQELKKYNTGSPTAENDFTAKYFPSVIAGYSPIIGFN